MLFLDERKIEIILNQYKKSLSGCGIPSFSHIGVVDLFQNSTSCDYSKKKKTTSLSFYISIYVGDRVFVTVKSNWLKRTAV